MWCGRRRKLFKGLALTVLCSAVVHYYLISRATRRDSNNTSARRSSFDSWLPSQHFMSPLRYSEVESSRGGQVQNPVGDVGNGPGGDGGNGPGGDGGNGPGENGEDSPGRDEGNGPGGNGEDSPGGGGRNGLSGDGEDSPGGDGKSKLQIKSPTGHVTMAAKTQGIPKFTESVLMGKDHVTKLSESSTEGNFEDFRAQNKFMENTLKRRGERTASMLMFANLKPSKESMKKRPRLYFDLSAKAHKEGRIGPFIDTKRTLKFYNESRQNETKNVTHILDEMISMSDYDSLPHVLDMLRSRVVKVVRDPDRKKSFHSSLSYPKNSILKSRDDNGRKSRNTSVHSETSKSLTTIHVNQRETNPKSPNSSHLRSFRRSIRKLPQNSPQKHGPKTKPKKSRLSHKVDPAETSLNEAQISELKKKISRINEEQIIANEKSLGPVEKDCTIFVVQVHRRASTLRELVRSLTEALQGAPALVVFSHDFWSDELNAVVGNVTTLRTMQIFFPFSIQLHPHVFPGLDPRDCAWNHERNSGQLRMKNLKICQNEQWPDSYGHYREARFTQIKHHWWWNKFRVFDELRVTRNWAGVAVFLEDDNYVAPDVLHVLKLLVKMANNMANNTANKMADNKADKMVPRGKFFALGTSAKFNSKTDRNTVYLETLGSPKLNIGLAFDRVGWAEIKQKTTFFCSYDDYNWDWTLAGLMHGDNRLLGRALALRPSRVFHMNSCGTHSAAADCDRVSPAAAVQQHLQKLRPQLFPKSLQLKSAVKSKMRKSGNGGWGDRRDVELCFAVANGTASEVLQSLQLLPSL